MKRVFEFYTGKGQQDITTLAESLECVRRSGKPTRITIEPLPESKPEPLNPEQWPGKIPIAYDKEGNAVGFEPEPKDPCENCPFPGGRNCFENCRCHPDNKEPEKNCGNCTTSLKDDHVCGVCGGKLGKEPMLWSCEPTVQPKSSEKKAEGWEQRFDKEFGFLGDDRHESCTVIQDLKSFIRAEIEQAKSIAFEEGRLKGQEDGYDMALKQNKHRSEK